MLVIFFPHTIIDFCFSDHSPERNESEQDSLSSLDQTLPHADELFLTDDTDSSPDKNLEIKRCSEIPSPDLLPRRSRFAIPFRTVSQYGKSGSVSVSTPNILSSSMGDVLAWKQLSPIGPSVPPPSQFAVETHKFQKKTLKEWSPLPDVRNVYFSQEPVLGIRSFFHPPGTGLCSTSENVQNPDHDLTSSQTAGRADSSMSISPAIDPPLEDFSPSLPAEVQAVGDASSPFLPVAVSSPTDTSIPVSSAACPSNEDFSTPISSAAVAPSRSTDITEITELLNQLSVQMSEQLSESLEQVENILKELLNELSPEKKFNSPPTN